MDYKCTNLEELKANSVRLYDGMIVVWPQLSYKEEPLPLHFDVATLNERIFALNNGTLAFTADGSLFATPATRAALTLLNNEGYKGHAFYVPFSNWDYLREWWMQNRKKV